MAALPRPVIESGDFGEPGDQRSLAAPQLGERNGRECRRVESGDFTSRSMGLAVADVNAMGSHLRIAAQLHTPY